MRYLRSPQTAIDPRPLALAALVVLIAAPALVHAQTFRLLHTFDDPTVTTEDQFGIDVAIQDNHVLIGAFMDDTAGTDVGQAHQFDATRGNLIRTIDDPNVTSGDRFGFSVAVDAGGLLIGDYWDDTNGLDNGRAYRFDAATGNRLTTYDDPNVLGGDRFGYAVAFDGNHVLIGEPADMTQGSFVGRAQLINASTGAVIHTFDDPSATTADQFGNAVAIDRNYILISDHSDDTYGLNVGRAHLFDAASGNLLRTFDDPNVTTADQFGYDVAIDGDHVLISDLYDDTDGPNAGRVHLFDAVTGNRLHTFQDPTPTALDTFGIAVAIDGNYVLIGDYADDTHGNNVGQAHLFDATTGAFLQTFNDPTVTTEDHFGISVAIDGDRVLIGARWDDTQGTNVGQAHLFVRLPGDINGDGVVDVADLALVGAQWGTPGLDPLNADIAPALLGDDIVDVADLALVGANWQTSTGPSTDADATTVPTPTALACGCLALTGLIRRRR
ncbi:MAG: hypothetical protein CMJ49_04090 [Planctomycetaceae bacterium]|nr:hypothetical protein [Planctomycetaceae bacterium]